MARNTIFIFLIRCCLLLITLFGYIFYSRNLDIEEYGVYAKVILVCLPIFMSISSFGIGSIIFNFNPEGLQHILRTSPASTRLKFLLFNLGVGLIYGFVVAAFSAFSLDVIITAAIFLCLQVWNYCLDNIALLIKQYLTQLWINIGYMIAVVYIHYYAIANTDFSIYSLISLWSIILFIKLGIQLFILKGYLFKDIGDIQLVQIPTKKTWIDLGINDILQIILRQIDKIIITAFSSASAAAIYFNGRMEIPILPTILSSVKSAALIQLAQSKHEKNSIINTVQWSFKILSAITIGIMIWGLYFKTEIVVHILGTKYLPSIPFLIVTLLMLPSQYCIAITYLLQYKERANIINRSVILELCLSILFMIPCYAIWGALGIAIGVLISSYLVAFYLLYMSSKVSKIKIMNLIPLRFYVVVVLLNWISAWGIHRIASNLYDSISTLVIGALIGSAMLLGIIKFGITSIKK